MRILFWAGGVQDDGSGSVFFFEYAEKFVHHGDFFGEVFRFTLGVSGAVGPAHPGGHAVDSGVASGGQARGEALFDEVVAGHGRPAGGR